MAGRVDGVGGQYLRVDIGWRPERGWEGGGGEVVDEVAAASEEVERGGDGGGVWGKAFEDRGVADETHEFLYFERVKLKNRRSKEQ